MRKLIIMLAALLVLPLALSACGGSAEGSTDKPVSHAGTWKAEGLEATVTADTIEINIVGQDTKSLYWKGTFQEGSSSVISKADTEALASSMLGSQDAEKKFTVEDDSITFEISMMGTTKTVHLKR